MKPIPLLRRWSTLTTLGLVTLLVFSGSASATVFQQPGFTESVVFSGLSSPTTVRFLPDGRVLVAEKSGIIKVFPDLLTNTPSVVVDLRNQVHNFWDRGLLGLEIDPNFATNHYIYVLYTYDAPIGGASPVWGPGDGTSDPCPSPPGATTDGCIVSARLSRLTAVGANWTSSENVLIEDWCQQFPSHSVGALAFGADGMLYVSGGDGANFGNTDWGQFGGSPGSPTPANPCGDPPVPVGGDQTKPTAEGGALRSQSPLRLAGEPRVLNGSILRIDPATGQAPPDNPLFSSTDANERRIIGFGLRNPFRMIVKPGTNDIFVADVGWNTWEELNRIPDHTTARNFGWPCYEGNSPQYTGLDICPAQAQTTAPLFTYNHASSVVPGDGCLVGSSSVAGMAFYQGAGNYPPSYNGAFFFSDYSRQCMWVMYPDGSGTPDPSTRAAFASSVGGPVDLAIGPDGDVYYVDFNGGNLVRIKYGLAAIASATSPTSGNAPLTVSFDGTASQKAQPGDTLSYAWDLDGDGQFDDSTSPQPSKTYSVPGTYIVRLQVTDQTGASDVSSPIVVTSGNNAPTATILTPSSGLTWQVGDVIGFSGSATDIEDGTLASSALSWQIIVHHCPSTCHTHVYQTFSGIAAGTFPAPDHDYPSFLEIQLTATDSGGLTNTTSVNINPQTVVLTFDTIPSGLQLTIGASASATPFTRTVIVNSQNEFSAPTVQAGYQWVSWSDGGAASHNRSAPPTPTTYTATYTLVGGGLPIPWQSADIGTVGAAGSASFSAGTFTISGSGADIESVDDAFHYVYQPLDGDGTIIARVVTQEDTDEWAKAGVMIRETLNDNSKHAMTVMTPGHGVAFQRRTVTGGATDHTPGALVTVPYWVQLVRSGDTFSGFSSPDGLNWTLVGLDIIPMSESVFVGMPVTSHKDGFLCAAIFDNVSVSGGPANAPTATIDTPTASLTWKVGDTVSFSGHATDPQDGALDPSQLSWSIYIHHCPSTCQTILYETIPGVASGSFIAPDYETPVYLEIQLTATDSNGQTNTESVNINPQTVDLTLQSVPAGLQLTAGSKTAATPFAKTSVVGSQVTLDAPSPQGSFPNVWDFSAWSDAGAQSHVVTAPPTPATYTATYTTHADLSIGVSAAPEPVGAGATLTYTISVANAGPSQANALTVTDTLPPGVTFVSASGAGWNCSGTGPVACTLPSLGIASAAPISIAVTAPASAGVIVDNASVSATTADAVPANNSASATSNVFARADLSITQLGAPDAVCPGQPVTYTLNVANGGPSDATSVSVIDTLPAGASLVSAAGTGWACSGTTTVTCTRPTLPVGAAPSIAVVVNAPSTPGTATNVASVSSATNDPSAANNSSNASTTVNPAPATPSASNNGPVCVGDTLQLSTPFVAGATYSWTGPNGFLSSLQNPSIPGATVANSGVYSVTITVATCASLAGTTTATVNPPPAAVVSGSATICQGDSTQIQASLTGIAPWTVTWSDGTIQAGVPASPAVRTVSPASTTVYTVTAVSDAHCAGSATGNATVTVGTPVTLPVLTAPLSTTVGETGVTASVPQHSGSTYTWTLTGGTITAGQGTAQITFSAGPPGTTMDLQVTESNTGCVSPSADARIQVDFLDVPPSDPFHDFVNTIARNAITVGCGNGNYCPGDPSTRAQMAVFLLKAKFGSDHVPPPATGTVFDDVHQGDFAADWIEELHALGVTGGCDADNYCPNAPVTRGQMAVFLLKTLLGSAYVPPPAQHIFADVPADYFSIDWIEDLYNRQITGGCLADPLSYCPDAPNTRGQMAVFLTKTFGLQ